MPLDDRGDDILVEPAGSEIVQEQKRFRSLDDDVVDAHRHQVDSDRVKDAALDRDLHLGADAVVGGDEDRIDESGRLEIEKATKAAEFGIRSRTTRRARHGLDPIHETVADVDVDAGVGVGQRFAAVGHSGSKGRVSNG